MRFRLACLNLVTGLFLIATIIAACVATSVLFWPGPPLRITWPAGPALLSPSEVIPLPSAPPLSPVTATAEPTPSATSSPTVTPTPTETPTETPSATPYANLVLGPYLQSPNLSEIVVVWEVDQASPGEVAFGRVGGELVVESDASPPRRHHEVVLTGLEPGTSYRYQVRLDGAPLAPERTFQTWPAGGDEGLRFAVLGDTQTGHTIHRSIVERIASWEPDFVLHTGDLVADGTSTADWLTFFDLEAPLLAQRLLFPTLGNHDMGPDNLFAFFDPPGSQPWYTFQVGPARFITLQIDGRQSYDEGSEQYRWLEALLEENELPWVIVWFHMPPFSASSERPEEVSIRQELVPLFDRYAVDLVLNGHDHNYQRYEVGHVTYIVTGGGGGNLHAAAPEADGLGAYAMAHHFVGIRIQAGTLTGEAIAPDGSVIDRFSISD